MPAEEFPFSGLTGRPPGPVIRALGTVLPGVSAVQRQVAPYAAAWRSANAAALGGARVRWIALGDSMTQGVGASSPQSGWVGQLRARLSDPVDVVNLSQSGGRVEDVVELQIPAWQALDPAPAGEILTVLIGSNDLMSPRHRGRLPVAIEALLARLPTGAIVSAVPSPASPARAANARIAAAASEGQITMVRPDRLDALAWRGKLAADRFHPNDAGYAMIADVFAAAVGARLAALS